MITKLSRGSQYFIFDEQQLKDLLDTKNVLCNETFDADPFAFIVYSKYQDINGSEDFVCVSRVSTQYDRFLRKSIRVHVPEGTKFLEIYPFMHTELKDVIDPETGKHQVFIVLPNDSEILLEEILEGDYNEEEVRKRLTDCSISKRPMDLETSQKMA